MTIDRSPATHSTASLRNGERNKDCGKSRGKSEAVDDHAETTRPLLPRIFYRPAFTVRTATKAGPATPPTPFTATVTAGQGPSPNAAPRLEPPKPSLSL
jgi:hypothetical protein